MKKLLIVSAGIALAASVSAQATLPFPTKSPVVKYNANGSVYRQCITHFKTKTLLELIKDRDERMKGQPKKPVVYHTMDNQHYHRPAFSGYHLPDNNTPSVDESRQSTFGTLKVSFTAVNEDGSQSTQGAAPQDPNGMIGSNYYVQTINSDFAVYNKDGSIALNTTDLVNLFPGSDDWGDPVTVYDKMADRWIITELDDQGTGNIIYALIAVSVTNDPTGSYYEYIFEPDPSLSIMDYPKYTIWADGYYETCNCQGANDDVMCYQRDSMLVGGNAGVITMPWNYGPYNYGCGGNFFCPMMLDCDGTLPPYGSPEYLFYYWDDSWGCAGADSICIEQIRVNWTTQTGTVDGNYQHLYTSAFNSNFSNVEAFDNIIPQPGNNSANLLASTDGFFGYRIPYLPWSTYNSAVMQYPVNVGTLSAPIAGVRWYELHQDATSHLWSIYQQSTYAPSDGVSRWEAGIAMDQNGSIGLEFSVSDPNSTYPGLRYTGRRSCDLLNTMTVSEVTVVSGNALVNTYQNPGNRWGDYSHLSVDPLDGVTFWGCNSYAENGASGSQNLGSRLFNFQITPCITGIADVKEPTTQLTVYQNGGTLEIKGIDVPEGQAVNVELFDAQGKKLMGKTMVATGTNLETSFNVSTLAKAIYIVRLGNDRFQRVVKVNIQ